MDVMENDAFYFEFKSVVLFIDDVLGVVLAVFYDEGELAAVGAPEELGGLGFVMVVEYCVGVVAEIEYSDVGYCALFQIVVVGRL